MTQQDHEQKKRECWEEAVLHGALEVDKDLLFDHAFKCGYALGRKKEIITQEDIERAAEKYADELKVSSTIPGVMVPMLHDIAKSSYICGAQNILGKQEKDAEEEEMLKVSRKEVQDVYKYSEEIISNEVYGSKRYAIHIQTLCVLERIFGSKCLPDETCNIASNVASSEPYVDSSEPKTFKYSVGQKVILHFYGGEVSTITEAFNDGGVWNKYKVKALPTHVWNENELDPYEEPKPAEPDEKDDCQKFTKKLDDTLEGDIKEPFKDWYDKKYSNVEKLEKNDEPKPSEPKFKVGDKVRYKEFVGTVYQIEETDYVIRKLAGGDLIGWLKESDLEPYTEPTNEDFVTLGVESAEYLRKSLEESEYRNSSQNTANCDKQFNNILKDSFSKERRLNIAAMITQGIMVNSNPLMVAVDVYGMIDLAILIADTLIAECEKGGQK